MKPYRQLLVALLLLPVAVAALVRDWASVAPIVPALLIGTALLCIGLAALGRRVAAQRAIEEGGNA